MTLAYACHPIVGSALSTEIPDNPRSHTLEPLSSRSPHADPLPVKMFLLHPAPRTCCPLQIAGFGAPAEPAGRSPPA